MHQTTVLLIIAIVFISITWIRKNTPAFCKCYISLKKIYFLGFPDNSPFNLNPLDLYFLLLEHLLILTTGQDGFCNVTLSTGQNISTLCHVNNNQWTVMFLFDFLQKMIFGWLFNWFFFSIMSTFFKLEIKGQVHYDTFG